jgi:pimeloyl-ACP methyl ester carboxylesterase
MLSLSDVATGPRRKEKAMKTSANENTPLVLVPCFSGAPWNTKDFPEWSGRILVTGRLPAARTIDEYANIVESWTEGLDEYILVGDSFGAFVSLALAQRQPSGLKGLVLSGGFAKADISWQTRVQLAMARLLGQVGYPLTVKFWVRGLGSRFDPPGTDAELRSLFLEYSDAKTFVNRSKAVLDADLRPGLSSVSVPTLVLTPEDDRLIGAEAAEEMVHRIPDAEEIVLKGTGHLLRFTHENDYATAVKEFIARKAIVPALV